MIDNRADELEIFKSRISLTEYAQALGYAIDTKLSSKNCHVMRDGSGDKIVIARGHNDHDMYFSVRSAHDNGTIVDFVQNRLNLNLGQVRKELRPWAGLDTRQTVRSRKRAPEATRIERPAPVDRDKASLLAAFHRLTPYTDSYLESERKLAPRTIAAFAPVILQDEHKNACFLHTDSTGDISGWEKKNHGFTGFASGGVKTFFQHMPEGGDMKRLIITESAIDAMSYQELHGAPGDCYLSCGGALSDQQRAELERIVRKAPAVVAATDNDIEGHAMAEMIKSWKPDMVRAVPEHGKDWNNDLKNCKSKERSRSLNR